MPLRLKGSCRCGAVGFAVDSHTPVPYQLCYCTICRKTAGGGGYAINIMGANDSLTVTGQDAIAVYQAEIAGEDGACETSSGRRNLCRRCGSALWLWDETWPDLIHPFASAIDTDLPKATEKTHLMLRFKASWVEPNIGPKDKSFDLYPRRLDRGVASQPRPLGGLSAGALKVAGARTRRTDRRQPLPSS